jgi:hypothetical protein
VDEVWVSEKESPGLLPSIGRELDVILRNEEERHAEREAQRSGGDWRVEAVESWAGAEDVGRRMDVSKHMTYARKAKCGHLT